MAEVLRLVPSGIPVHRPMGQTLPNGETDTRFWTFTLVDFELETAFITTDANIMGENIPVMKLKIIFLEWFY
jgi:fumarylacetoacetase